MEVLQTSALPLGYVASISNSILRSRRPEALPCAGVVSQDFKDAMARLAAGVVVVSARAGDGFRGLTASTLVSVSADPPLVLVGLERESATRVAVIETRRFNVSVLTREQEFLAERFAGRAPSVDPAWKQIPHRLGANGIPLIDGCAAWLECEVEQIHAAGDHDVCIGSVRVALIGAGNPLILWDRAFWTLR
jgi:flavin reductase (DIM6/NTAB) family NADH-FMN oxidoreductase RutF